MAQGDFSCCASPAADVIAHALANQVNHNDIQCIIQCQKQVLGRLEKTNEMLINCNALSATRFAVASQDLKKHTQLLFDLKKDLDSVFKRIRFLKMKLAQQYPAAFSACNTVFYAVDEEDEPEERYPPSKAQAEKAADTTEKQKHVGGQQLEETHSGSSTQSSVTS
ncbi:kxDL motif-containing protein CG10681 [Rhipicephalus sanguineus]|uniref:kxDL motif-containing protein CG10681 n=1 Tax=Rhipicephalus sanguineus TaxID=34632 RepID=UPI0018946151|nr:kxDL motif-containing protein CG10681 [Rhipicephalus sanguineus]